MYNVYHIYVIISHVVYIIYVMCIYVMFMVDIYDTYIFILHGSHVWYMIIYVYYNLYIIGHISYINMMISLNLITHTNLIYNLMNLIYFNLWTHGWNLSTVKYITNWKDTYTGVFVQNSRIYLKLPLLGYHWHIFLTVNPKKYFNRIWKSSCQF